MKLKSSVLSVLEVPVTWYLNDEQILILRRTKDLAEGLIQVALVLGIILVLLCKAI